MSRNIKIDLDKMSTNTPSESSRSSPGSTTASSIISPDGNGEKENNGTNHHLELLRRNPVPASGKKKRKAEAEDRKDRILSKLGLRVREEARRKAFNYIQFATDKETEFGSPLQKSVCLWADVPSSCTKDFWRRYGRKEAEYGLNKRRSTVSNTNMKGKFMSKCTC
jgi:hypothetical protein